MSFLDAATGILTAVGGIDSGIHSTNTNQSTLGELDTAAQAAAAASGTASAFAPAFAPAAITAGEAALASSGAKLVSDVKAGNSITTIGADVVEVMGDGALVVGAVASSIPTPVSRLVAVGANIVGDILVGASLAINHPQTVADAASYVESAIDTGAAEVSSAISSAASSAEAAISSGAADLGTAISAGLSSAETALGDLASEVGSELGDAISTIGQAISSVASSIGNAIGNAAATSADAIGNALAALGKAIGDAGIDPVTGIPIVPVEPSFGPTSIGSPHYEPLVFNLTGKSTLTTPVGTGAIFDQTNNGFKHPTGWAAPGQGILVYDPSGGTISNASQLFGTAMELPDGSFALDGFQALAQFDSNGDGKVDAGDAVWSSLDLWIDSDGVAGSGELVSLSQAGIVSISLVNAASNTTDVQGNQILSTGNFTWSTGGSGQLADVNFVTDPTLSISDSGGAVSSEVAGLPDLPGFGMVSTLHQSMALDSNGTLEGLVEQFASALDTERDSLADQIIIQWAGVGNVSVSSRGEYSDGQQLGALEKFVGTSYIDPATGDSDPSSLESAAAVAAAYNQYHEQIYAELMAQTVLAPLFQVIDLTYDPVSTTFVQDLRGRLRTVVEQGCEGVDRPAQV